MTSLRLGLLAGLVLPLGLATATLAQPAAPATPPAASGMRHHWDPAAHRARMAERLRAILQLTPAQEPALDAFLASMRPPPGGMGMGMGSGMGMRPGAGPPGEALPLPARLDRMLAHMDAMRARFAAHVAAVKTFYAQLTPPQQRAFDAIAPMMMHDMHDMHGGMGGDWMHRHHDHDGDGDHGVGPGGPRPW